MPLVAGSSRRAGTMRKAAGMGTTSTVLYAGCLPGATWEQFVGAAAGAGFDAVTVWPSMYRKAVTRQSLEPSTMRRVLDDAGIGVAAIEACGDWLPDRGIDAAEGPFRSIWGRQQFFD